MSRKKSTSLETTLYDLQYEYIRAKFGDAAADNANYGWGASFESGRWSIATKVYGHGIVQTEATCLEDVEHDFRPF